MKKKIKIFFHRNKIQYHFLLNFLNKNKIYLADIGSTGGVSSNWEAINELMFYYTFDPDPRAKNKFADNSVNFKFGLWSRKKKAFLYQTKFPDASSIYKPNESFLKFFKNHKDHEVIDKIEINVATLDQILQKHLKPDFIKIDAEGADFNILKGSTKILSDSCIGVQCETQFSERNINSPFFSDIDIFLRKKGFILFDINLERWRRKEDFYSLDSREQVIWGDSFYILGINEIIKRTLLLNSKKRKVFLSKIILICISLKIYDYPVDIIRIFLNNKWLTQKEGQGLIKGIKENIYPIYKIFIIEILFLLFNLIVLIISFLYIPILSTSYRRFKRNFLNLFILFSKLFS